MIKRIFAFAAAVSVFFTGCDSLQSSLSEEMQAKLDEETGVPSYSEKAWYYNGVAGEDVSDIDGQTLLVTFGKKTAANSVTGKIVLTYSDETGTEVTKTFSSVSGYFTSDFTGYRLNMSPVTALLDGEEIPSGTAKVSVSLGGFVCAEGKQNGRALSAFEAKNINVKPLFSKESFSYSTAGFSTSSKFAVTCNAPVSVAEGVTAVGVDSSSNTYRFNVTADENTVYLSPDFASAPADGTEMTITLSGILADGCGDTYSKKISASFSENLIAVDGIKDDNWLSENAVYVSDASSDGSAFTWDANSGDFTGLYVLNDDNYLYVALEGSFATTWSDGLAVMISYDHSSDAAYSSGSSVFALADTVAYGRETLMHGKPDIYLYHKPQSDEFGAWVENASSADEISSAVKYSPDGDTASAEFIEYAIPLSSIASAGIEKGKTVHIIAASSLHWSAGVAAGDVVPDACAGFNDKHNSVTINFQNALEYTLN
ncbi:hypothetical protein DYE49_10355 [Treponema rectale]|uniref:Uncharacterized protein n=1 Tax=Treponema rectale TaxID=744512 RepID=A0A840SEV5_9SPIR|nr:hypothetical protein [Treponema rectale]MBB5219285.1 hypothetical protein [Treponema rectale]QOS40830.1 hypothetical protein DYE49_10355 [Treponema rectale]